MLSKLLLLTFDRLLGWWESPNTPRLISKVLIAAFVLAIALGTVIDYFELHDRVKAFTGIHNHFFAIEVAFYLLLFFEVLGLVFELPRSVADSLGKQFEILSIILLRSAFKEFGKLGEPISWDNIQYVQLYPMLADAFGALLIFLTIGFYYRQQKHARITKSIEEQTRFIRFKKVIAGSLLLAFFALMANDCVRLLTTGTYKDSLNTFYTILVFSDVLILLYSLRYHSRYTNLFRYSSFAFATVLIRLALSAPAYANVIIGILAGFFMVGITLAYNFFNTQKHQKGKAQIEAEV